jgi:hypothetical protein
VIRLYAEGETHPSFVLLQVEERSPSFWELQHLLDGEATKRAQPAIFCNLALQRNVLHQELFSQEKNGRDQGVSA